MKNRIRALVVATSIAVGTMAAFAPPAAAGPCDNEVERIYCFVVDSVISAIEEPWH